MRRKAWLISVAAALTMAIVLQALPAGAQVYDPDKDLPKPSGVEKSLTKLGRGLSNVFFSWAEIPITWDKKLKEDKPLAYLVGVAPVLGTARAFMRLGTGLFEVVSFPFSDKKVNFDAILEPEYIF